jgi:nucleotide-binding universal stress UspA family protein
MDQNRRPVVLVGVVPRRAASVVGAAADFAEAFGAELVCAHVDVGHYLVEALPDGSLVSLPVDPELLEETGDEESRFPSALRQDIEQTMSDRDVPWSTRMIAGEPARALSALAAKLNAAMIVVGTREPGLRGSLQEFLTGSVAVHLAHHQHRPVVVIPLTPAPEARQPWEQDAEA